MTTDDTAGGSPTPAESKRGFRVECKEGKVLLTVLPAEEADPRLGSMILRDLAVKGFLGFDEARVKEVVEAASGVPAEIGVHQPREAKAEVEIDKDGLSASIYFQPPDPSGKPMTIEAAKEALRRAGVKDGIDEAALAEMIEKKVYAQPRVVARGRTVEQGNDGFVKYHFEVERKVHLKENEETGQVDLKELGLIENCVEGQLLATIEPPTAGLPGLTVRGEYLAPKPGKPAKIGAGKGTVLSADESECRAAQNGQVYLAGGKVVVSPVYVVKGDVGPKTGNINFLGTVEVHGGVDDGYSIKAANSVVVSKTVGKVQIEAGKDIEIRGGMAGHSEGALRAGGDVRIRFLQEAIVEARGSVLVSDAIMHSTVEAGERVLVGVGPVESRKGIIVGGRIRALSEINCRTLGNASTTKTSVEVGINPKLVRRIEELSGELRKEKENFDKVRKGILSLKTVQVRLGGTLPPDKEKILSTLVGAQESLRTRLTELSDELQGLEAQAQVKVAGKVCVAGTAYPGVRIGIGSAGFYLTEKFDFTTFHEEEAEIRKKTYEEPRKAAKT